MCNISVLKKVKWLMIIKDECFPEYAYIFSVSFIITFKDFKIESFRSQKKKLSM